MASNVCNTPTKMVFVSLTVDPDVVKAGANHLNKKAPVRAGVDCVLLFQMMMMRVRSQNWFLNGSKWMSDQGVS